VNDQLIMMIRHGEKPEHSGRPHGVSADGDRDGHSLTVEGWVRAGALVELFAPGRGDPPAPLRRPDAVYATCYRGGHSKRSVQTVMPLAARLGLGVIDYFKEGEEYALARELSHRPGTALVSWHHNSMPAIAKHLDRVSPAVPKHWPEERYDVVWTFTRDDDGGWQFLEVPQMLLPGDLVYAIAG
jgi:hypothetical protein